MTHDNLLSQSVTALKGVGDKVAQRLEKIGIIEVQDLLFHLPLRYQDRTRLIPLGRVQLHQEVLVEATIVSSQIKFGRRRSLVTTIEEGEHRLSLRFFHFSNSQLQQLAQGVRLRCFGEARQGPASLELVHPEYQILSKNKRLPIAAELTPIYPVTEGLHQLSLRKLINQALEQLKKTQVLPELLPPAACLHDATDLSLSEALLFIHQPAPDVDMTLLMDKKHPSQRRLAYEELLAQQISMKQLKKDVQQHKAVQLISDGEQRAALLAALSFSLTTAQQKVIDEILTDIAKETPMQRLVQGDVGSGKTIVAMMAMIEAVAAGYQTVLMAPTELLAEQHLNGFTKWLEPLGIKVGWCVNKQKASQRKTVLTELNTGEIDVVIGTHALFQDKIQFYKLGLVVIDEQHRFGVDQRLALRDKGHYKNYYPHQLVMTATPIPRTLAMTAYADLSVSVIDELPPGRRPVATVVLPNSRREEVIQRVEIACREQRQVYWVCTLIEESEHLQCQAAEDAALELQQALPDVKIGLIHGRMKPPEKELVMQQFKAGDIALLVATTVIEVGVDVPNASLMVIENSERLGLAQLHQLRGRVGRGHIQSHCVLMYNAPLSKNGQARLSCLRETNDGFVIAQRDLILRGPGELLGTRQTGLPTFKVADLLEDQDLVELMPQAAEAFLAATPENSEALIDRWFKEKIGFGHV